jgi:hypothetical protein
MGSRRIARRRPAGCHWPPLDDDQDTRRAKSTSDSSAVGRGVYGDRRTVQALADFLPGAFVAVRPHSQGADTSRRARSSSQHNPADSLTTSFRAIRRRCSSSAPTLGTIGVSRRPAPAARRRRSSCGHRCGRRRRSGQPVTAPHHRRSPDAPSAHAGCARMLLP